MTFNDYTIDDSDATRAGFDLVCKKITDAAFEGLREVQNRKAEKVIGPDGAETFINTPGWLDVCIIFASTFAQQPEFWGRDKRFIAVARLLAGNLKAAIQAVGSEHSLEVERWSEMRETLLSFASRAEEIFADEDEAPTPVENYKFPTTETRS